MQIQVVLDGGQTLLMRRSARRDVLDRLEANDGRVSLALHRADTILVPEHAA
ncbi:hypothetical protein KM176_15355 [Pseudooceanicola sp. CBS1P-1]|uniref:Uncharacterized protein n=1 Tax=Pseudooceanicola albus TaxID=2692189 RepID=A0A6L7G893_9RHOB|nr:MULTISPECIES: hypothetical protein [Pseudooceanicola]MBT9385248.1 hypothetical protein [Pseudooceanicola endophyticus]MXN18893.1 hypothetical protein [Pseudooceanicola albus]